jgi:hypothetical protein
LLDLLLSLAESVPTRVSRGSPDSRLARETFAESVPIRVSPLLSYLLAPRELWPLLRSNNPTSPSTPSWRVRQVPLPLKDRIARAIALNYNLSTCYLIIVIILQESLFLRDMIKYIQ